jgi:hypothetical protein
MLLHEMAKNSFHNFRAQWKRQKYPVAAAKALVDGQDNWQQRRVTVGHKVQCSAITDITESEN